MVSQPTPDSLVAQISAAARADGRVLVGIAGAPASGKSTLAADLAARLGPVAAVLPMDGFHLDNETLERAGMLDRKGAPHTFDAAAFVKLVAMLKTADVVQYPTFDRARDCTVPDAGQIDAATRIVLIEGNYLLLDVPPWDQLADLFDLTVAIDVPLDVLEARLVARWRDHGLDHDAAVKRARGNDLKNAVYVEQHARPAEHVMRFTRP